MAASVEYRNVMKEKEDDLSLFLEMRNREMGRNNNFSVLQNSDEFDDSFGSKPKITSTMHGQNAQADDDDFVDSENDKTDYDWLLTPPCAPLFSSLERPVTKATGNSKCQTTAPRQAEPALKPASKTASTIAIRSSSAGVRRPSSSLGTGSNTSRAKTPTGRPMLHAKTPTQTLAASKSTSKPATPTCRPSTPSSIPSTSGPTGQSSAVMKSVPTITKKPGLSRGNSPTVKSRSGNPLEKPDVSNDGPKILRLASTSRERPSVSSAQQSSTETTSRVKPRQKPSSPLRGRVSSENSQNRGRPVIMKSRKYSSNNDEVNPVLMGTQMVERVVNMRKLAPPKQDDPNSNYSNSSGKSSSRDSSGFGRSLSKISLDMAMRHMDIRRSISSNMRSLMKDVPASSVYSVRSGSTKLRTNGTSDSLVTSSDASSERSFNTNSHGLDGSEVDDIDVGSEGGHSSSKSQEE